MAIPRAPSLLARGIGAKMRLDKRADDNEGKRPWQEQFRGLHRRDCANPEGLLEMGQSIFSQ
jgi:hypothetical protein